MLYVLLLTCRSINFYLIFQLEIYDYNNFYSQLIKVTKTNVSFIYSFRYYKLEHLLFGIDSSWTSITTPPSLRYSTPSTTTQTVPKNPRKYTSLYFSNIFKSYKPFYKKLIPSTTVPICQFRAIRIRNISVKY